tara:strand:+ start:61 stop:507 length:447 start_codon:yes stop_codon:yes gene_type:complete
MKLKNKITFISILYFTICFFNNDANSKENFFDEAKNLYEKQKYEKSKFLFQRNIVFNPKHAKSYLYLAKIYLEEEKEGKQEKNLNTSLLLDPNDEEAIYMLINIKLKKSNFSKVKELTEKFEIVCSLLCNKTPSIKTRLNEIEAKEKS